MGMTGQEWLEKYNKKKQESNTSSKKTTETTGEKLTGSQWLEKYTNKQEQTTQTTESWDKYKEFANSKEASSGWQKYLADTEASKQAEKKVLKYDLNEDGKEAWWEKALGRLGESGYSADTTLPMANTTQAINDLRTTGLPDYTTPEDDWNDEQRNIFGYLYSTNPDEASKYAEYLNTEAKEKEALQKIKDSATDNFWAGAAHTAGAIATAPLGLADFLNDLVMANAGVSNTQYDGTVSPFEYSQAVTGGISEHLNENYGTIDESIPIIGGKGWGDVYGLGTSIAQSAVSGYTMGGLGTLVSYFGQGAASGVDDALSRGASEEQAVLYGALQGLAEGVAESIGIDNLFKLGASPARSVIIKNILKQAGAEGLEEGLTSIMSNAIDNVVMGDQSNFNAMVEAYIKQGMTEEKAKWKAWDDSIQGILFDMAGGFISGGVHGGAQTSILNAVDNHKVSQTYGDNQSIQDLLSEAVDIGGEAANVADKYVAKYGKKGKLSGADLNEIVYTNDQELRTQDKAKIKSAAEAKLTEYGETGDVSAIADILVKQASGEKLTTKEANTLKQSEARQQVSAELDAENLKSGLLANDWARDIETDKINSDVYTRDLYDLAEQKVTKKGNSSTEAERVIESKFKVSESGKTSIDGNEASIKEIASVKDGAITLRLENGETVNANDVEFSSSDEMLYATVVDMNLNAETANAFIRGFNATEGLSVEQYALGFREAYKYGSYGFPVQEMSRDGFSAALNESQKSLAYGAMGLPKGTKDYTYMQNEKLIKPTYHEYRGRLVKDKATNYMPNEYWDFSKSGKENAEAYLKMCAENNKRPKFYKFLDYDGKGTYSLKADGSTDGYWKLLIDFKMYDNDGFGSPQRAVTPTFNMDEARTMLDEYKGGHASYPVAHGVVDKFVSQYEGKSELKYSDRDPREVTESDVRDILDNIEKYDKDSYFPVRINTPQALIDAAEKRGDIIENLPVVMQVKKAQQAMSEEVTRSSIERAHGLSSDDMIAILKGMDNPTYIVYQENGRYAEIVRFETETKKRAIAILEIGENKNAIHMNGYEGGLYQVLVTAFVPDSYQYIKDILNNKKNTNLPIEKKKDFSQRSSGSHVPSLLNESPFFEVSISQNPDSVKGEFSDTDIRYSDREIQPITETEYETLKKHFGVTANFRVAGYLLPDGKLLDFSGKHWGDTTSRSRQVDHRDVQEVLERGNNGISDMVDMIGSGSIRLMPETGGINLAVYPNEKQRRVLSLYIKQMLATEGQVIIDYDSVGGDTVHSRVYEKYASSAQILSDIRNYFNGARQSDLMSFHTMYSDRDTDSVSNRSLLANALESVAQNDIEKTKLTQYKEKIALIESEQKKLEETRAKIKELSFAKGARDTEAIKKLQFDANQIANRINTYDKQLLNLESTKALKGVLEREKSMLRKRLEQKGKESLAAYREKATKTQRELLTRYQEARKNAVEGRNKTAMRHKIKNVVSDLNKLLLNPTKEQHVPIGLQGVVADALDAINMDTMNAEERVKYYNDLIAQATTPEDKKRLTEKRDFFAYRDMNFKERITALKNAYAEFKESDDPLIRNAHNDAIAELIKNVADSVGNISLKDMSFGQLEAVYDMYKAVLATVRNANKMFKEGRQETVTENSEAVKVEVKEVGGHQDRVLKAAKFFKKFGWDMLKPVTAMKAIGSKTLAKLFDNVRAAEDTWAVDVNEAKEFYESIAKKYGYDKWDFKGQYTFEDSQKSEFSISLEQMLSLYAYSKREQADEHLEFGGFIFDDAIEVTEKNKLGIPVKYEVNDANPHRLGQIQIMEITGKLTQEQRAFVDEMQTYLSDVMGAKGNEVSLALYDIKLYKEKNYFPLKTARYFREFDPEKSGTPKIKNSGFSKKTVPQAGNPIVLSNFMDVWASHVNDMSMYHAFVLPLEDFMRVYNYSSTAGGYDSVQQYIKNAYGSQANQYIERLMDDLNGGARVDSSADPINKGISLFKKASVFASASVVVQQPSAIARAFAYINPKYFATSTGSALNLKKHNEVWAEVKQYAPVAVIKEMGYFDTGMGRSTVEWIKGNKTIKDKMDDALSKAPAKADELSWSYIWLAVKNEIKDTTDLTPGSEEFLKKVGERFTEIITNTQVYDSVLSRSGMMRSKDTGMKMATAFMAEPTTTVNMMIDGILQGMRGNKKFLASTVGAVSASIILNSILVALVYAARDDDEDETYTEKYVGSLTSELVDGFNPLTYIPFVKDIWSIAQGYDVERSDMSVVSNLWESIEGLFNENKSGWEKVTDATGAVSSLFGIPLKNIIRDAKGMYNLTETLLSGTPTTGAGISEAIGDAFTSSIPLWDRLTDSDSTSARLYKAILKGDSSRYRSQYKTEAAYETAVRNALRDNDSRIKEAAQARYEGDIAEYTRIARSIISEGNFSQDIVVGAINAEMNAIKRGETTATDPTEDKDEVTSIYSGSDVNSAFDNGDYALGQQIISELIETKVANGMIENNAKSSVRSSMTSYWKPLYKQAYQSGDTNEMARIRQILYSSGLYGSANEVVKTTQSWLKS